MPSSPSAKVLNPIVQSCPVEQSDVPHVVIATHTCQDLSDPSPVQVGKSSSPYPMLGSDVGLTQQASSISTEEPPLRGDEPVKKLSPGTYCHEKPNNEIGNSKKNRNRAYTTA